MGDFLSPSALKIIAEDYQQGLLDRLNEQIKRCAYFSLGLGDFTNSNPPRGTGTRFENKSVAQIVISTATDKSQTLAFNYASLALNHSFFLHHLVLSRLTSFKSLGSFKIQIFKIFLK